MHSLAAQGFGSDNTTKLRELMERKKMDMRAWSAILKKSDEGMKLLGNEPTSALDQVTFNKTAHRDLEIQLEEVRTENVQVFDKCKKAMDQGRSNVLWGPGQNSKILPLIKILDPSYIYTKIY